MRPAPYLLSSIALNFACAPESVPEWSPSAEGIAGRAGAQGSSGGAGASGDGAAASGGLPLAAGAAGAAGAGASGGPGSGGQPTAPEPVGVFVAQGHAGRIARSCDGGHTLVEVGSSDLQYRCFSDAEHDCDHSPLAGRGLAFGRDGFVATWGWGHPGKLQRSPDGQAWTDVLTDTPTFADVAYGNARFVACGNPTRVSSDGMSWQPGGKLSFDFNYRGIEFVEAGGGTFVVAGESGEQRAISTSPDGVAWSAPRERPAPCGQQLRGIAGSTQIIVIASAAGHVCRSLDAGQTWEHEPVTERFTSPPVWTGTEFVVFEGARRWSSDDGEGWSSTAVAPTNVAIGPLARSPSGTWLAANDGWQVWYEKQQVYRSTDEGKSWQPLAPGAFLGSHPINFIAFGFVAPSAGCGAP